MEARDARTGGAVGYGRIIGLIALTQLIITSDFLIISVALPSIGHSFAARPDLLSWVVAANALTFAGFMTVGGRLGDLFGRRTCFLAGAGLFALATLLSAAAASLPMLIATRALQGIGTAILAPTNFSLLNTLLPEGPVRHRAFGIFGMVQGGSLFLGLLMGGMLITALGWRAVFVLNIPLLGVAAWLAWRTVPPMAGKSSKRPIDFLGAVLVVVATALVIRALSALSRDGWTSPGSLAFVAAGLAAFALFFLVERRVADPLLPPAIFGHPGVVGANLATLSIVAGASALFVVLNVYLQRVLGFSALMSGLSLMPYASGILLGGFLAARGMDHWPVRANLLLGSAFASLSLLLFQRLSAAGGYTAGTALTEVLAATCIIFSLVTAQAASTRCVPTVQQGVGAALQLMAQQFGTALGASVALSLVEVPAVAGQDTDAPYHAALLAAAMLIGLAFPIALLPASPGRADRTLSHERNR